MAERVKARMRPAGLPGEKTGARARRAADGLRLCRVEEVFGVGALRGSWADAARQVPAVRSALARCELARRLPSLVAEVAAQLRPHAGAGLDEGAGLDAAVDLDGVDLDGVDPEQMAMREVGAAEALAEAELQVVELVEAAKAVLDGVALTALARLRADIEAAESARVAACGRPKPPGWVEAEALTVLEVCTATGLGQQEVATRLALATCPHPAGAGLRARLAAGTLGLHRAGVIHTETRDLPAGTGSLVVSAVLRANDDAPPSPTLLRQRLNRACLAADPEAAGTRRREARGRRRGAYARIDSDGLGVLTVTNDADQVLAAIERLDAIARAARAAGDPRSLDVLRADAATDLLNYGWPTPEQDKADGAAAHPAVADGAVADAGIAEAGEAVDDPEPDEAEPDDAQVDMPAAQAGEALEGGEGGEGAGGHAEVGQPSQPSQPSRPSQPSQPSQPSRPEQPATGWWTRLGRHPAATVTILVPFTTAVGVTDAPCEIPGHGWVPAEQARQIILATGSTWRRLAVDLHTGAALALQTRSYRPTAAMRAHVQAVDGVCRAPGCTVPAARCDLDHDTPWPAGPTDVQNLTHKHRTHHSLHTHHHWQVHRDPHDPAALVHWRTKTGRTYTTAPKDWLEALRDHLTHDQDDHANGHVDRHGKQRTAAPPKRTWPDHDPPPF